MIPRVTCAGGEMAPAVAREGFFGPKYTPKLSKQPDKRGEAHSAETPLENPEMLSNCVWPLVLHPGDTPRGDANWL